MFLSTLIDFGASFRKYFEAVSATTDELRRESYRIRHAVYCEELHFEPEHADGLETDEFDRHSLHCLLRSVSSGAYVGCVRIILARPESPGHSFPFETACAGTLDRSIVDPRAIDRSLIAEVSRLAVTRQYRRRDGESSSPVTLSDSDFGDSRRPRLPYVPFGLYLGMIAMARQRGIKTLFVLSEPRFARHLSMLGVKIDQIGGAIEHRGTRVPCMISVEDVIENMNRFVKPLYGVIAEEIAPGRQSQPKSGPMTGFLPALYPAR